MRATSKSSVPAPESSLCTFLIVASTCAGQRGKAGGEGAALRAAARAAARCLPAPRTESQNQELRWTVLCQFSWTRAMSSSKRSSVTFSHALRAAFTAAGRSSIVLSSICAQVARERAGTRLRLARAPPHCLMPSVGPAAFSFASAPSPQSSSCLCSSRPESASPAPPSAPSGPSRETPGCAPRLNGGSPDS